VKERSDLDIGLDDGAEDAVYLSELDRGLARAVDAVRPDLVFYVAGADPYREDLLGGLALTREGMRERDRRVYAARWRSCWPADTPPTPKTPCSSTARRRRSCSRYGR
jgi:acetoin utilization deacetylase AcuC-like enzyme